MSFLLPQALLTLLLVPLLLGAYVFAQRRRRRYALRYASVSLVRDAVGRGPGIRRHVPAAIFLLAVAAICLALARPQVTTAVQQEAGTVMLSVDVSGSMQATDVSPSRMEATKTALRDFVKQQPKGVNVGLVAFSDTASLLQAPTGNKDLLLRAIAQLQPERGTNIGDGLRVALNALKPNVDLPASPAKATPSPVAAAGSQQTAPQSPGTVVLLSDGESNTGPRPLDVAKLAAAQGVRVDTVGIGTSAGIVLHIQGQSILTRLDESTLSGIATATAGHYYNAQDEAKLTQVYHDLAQQQHTENKSQEITFLVAAGAMLLLVAGGALSLFWFNRLP